MTHKQEERAARISRTDFCDKDGIFGSIMGEGNIQTEGKGLLTKATIWDDGAQVVESNPRWVDKTSGRTDYPEVSNNGRVTANGSRYTMIGVKTRSQATSEPQTLKVGV